MNKTTRLFQSRAASEDEASSFKPAHNHLYAGSLHELLDERKSARTHQDLINLANRYNIDVDKMERLARFVTSPSVDNNLNVRKVDKNGGVFVTLTVCSRSCYSCSSFLCAVLTDFFSVPCRLSGLIRISNPGPRHECFRNH